jgi:thiol:disulfide interchange protein DsbD
MSRPFVLAACALLLCAPAGLAASRAEQPHVTVELVSDVAALAPGASFTLGLRYVVEQEWHVYWVNPGDSGIEPKVRWRAPAGFRGTRSG